MQSRKSVMYEIKTASHLIRRRADKLPSKQCSDNLTGTHGFVIGFLCHNNDRDIFQRDIENEFSIRRSTATVLLQLMEKNGLITRERVEGDARLKKIVLTQKALDLHRHVEADFELLETEMTKNLTQNEIENFFCIMEKIKATLTNESGDVK